MGTFATFSGRRTFGWPRWATGLARGRPFAAGVVLIAALAGCQAQPQPGGSRPPAAEKKQNAQPQGKAMIDLFFEIPLEESKKIEIPPIPIRPNGTTAALPHAVPRTDAPCARPFCNDEWNSRVTGRVSPGQWSVLREAALNPKFPPSYISTAGDRILVEGGGQWQLLDTNGRAIASAAIKSGQAVMDPVHSLVYAVDQDGALSAYRFTDGQKVYTTSLAFGDTFWRQYLARSGDRLVVVGVDQEAFPHRPTPPNRAVVEVKELTEPLQVDPSGSLLSVEDTGRLRAESSTVAFAMHGSTLVFAVPGRVYLADLNLKVAASLEDSFEPVLMSLDEGGRIYLIVRRGEQVSLWVITPQGQRLLAYDIPREFGVPVVPPIVGYDHKVYLMGSGRSLAVNPNGTLAWDQPVSGPASVTADDQLLISAGSALMALDAKGTPRLVREFKGETLKTPPVTAGDGSILVASAQRLYRLSPPR
jgi:outer membrane protein assembly factor BamB